MLHKMFLTTYFNLTGPSLSEDRPIGHTCQILSHVTSTFQFRAMTLACGNGYSIELTKPTKQLTPCRLVSCYSIHVPGWLLKWLNLITAPGSVSNEPGSVTWLATKYLKTVSWRNHTEKWTTLWRQNISFWPKINISSSYFTILKVNCLENTPKLLFDSYVTAVKFLT